MFRAFISTFHELPHHLSTQKRKIISQQKNQIEFSPNNSPSKAHKPLSELIQIIQGEIYLFRQYKTIKTDYSGNTDSKSVLLKPYRTCRSNIVAVFNINEDQQKRIMQKLKSIQSEIENVDILRSSNDQETSMLVVFKNLLIAESFYTYIMKQQCVLASYLQNVCIYQRQKQNINHSKQSFFKTITTLLETQKRMTQKQISEQKIQWIQLPKCSQCLQKLQYELTGFHQDYLKLISSTSLAQTKCKTCKIIYQRSASLQTISESKEYIHCNQCKQKNDIWVCMVCGKIGCGRYKNADAYKHFAQSGHIIALDLQTERVWNYLSDCFSHRLDLINDLEHKQNTLKFPKIEFQNSMNQNTVLEGAFWQYCSIFSEQMEKQRIFYQGVKRKEKLNFDEQNQKLQKILKQLETQKEQKVNLLKKTKKNLLKQEKKRKEIEKEVGQERQKLNELEQYFKKEVDLTLIETDQQIVKKLSIIAQLDEQISSVLIKLSQS